MIRYGDRGPAVRQLQERLLAARYELPRYGADGALGAETWRALAELARDCGEPLAPLAAARATRAEVPRALVEALAQAELERDPAHVAPTRTLHCEGLVCKGYEGARIYDLRSERVPTRPKVSMRGGLPVKTQKKTGITVHQMSAEFGVSAAQLKAAGGDRSLALARRGLNVACHVAVFRPDIIVGAAPFDWKVNHGNGFNDQDIGLEFEGNFEGLLGKRSTLWCPAGARCSPTQATEQYIETMRAGVRWAYEVALEEGHEIQWVRAHRQSNASRRGDPGELIWREVVLGYAVPVLGLRVAPMVTRGGGRPIPLDWDPGGFGRY